MAKGKMKLLFLANVPSPYRVEFFNALSRECELTVLYQLHSSAERDKLWTAQADTGYRQVFLQGKATDVDKALCPGVTKWLGMDFDAVVICGNSSPTELLAIFWCKLRHIPYCLEGDGAFAGSGKGAKEWLKGLAVGGAGLYLSTCKELDNYYLLYGARKEKLRRYRFSSLTQADILPRCPTPEEKRHLRSKLGMQEEKILLSIGQFIPRKGFDLLLQAANGMDGSIGIYIVGGVPGEDYLRYAQENDLTNVHFVGFQTKQALKDYYMAADAFVLPTREDIWGLVVNEAMAFGLGVVTTHRCNAGLELIREGENGYLVPTGDVHSLRQAMLLSLEHSDRLGAAALETIRPYTVQGMAEDHMKHLTAYVQGLPNRKETT